MTKISLAVVSAALAIGMVAPVSAGINDPELIIYRFAGVRDSGLGGGLGAATAFSCTNFSGATENIRLVTRNTDTSIISNQVLTLAHLQSQVAATHLPNTYPAALVLNTGLVAGGTTAIAATSINVICTAMAIDASTAFPHGVSLRGVRFNPIPGSQE